MFSGFNTIPSPTPRNPPIVDVSVKDPMGQPFTIFFLRQLLTRHPPCNRGQLPVFGRMMNVQAEERIKTHYLENDNYQSRNRLSEGLFVYWEKSVVQTGEIAILSRLFPFLSRFRQMTDEDLIRPLTALVQQSQTALRSQIFSPPTSPFPTYTPQQRQAESLRIGISIQETAIILVGNLVLCERLRNIFLDHANLLDLVFEAILFYSPMRYDNISVEDSVSVVQMAYDWLYILLSLVSTHDERVISAFKTNEDVQRAVCSFATFDLASVVRDQAARRGSSSSTRASSTGGGIVGGVLGTGNVIAGLGGGRSVGCALGVVMEFFRKRMSGEDVEEIRVKRMMKMFERRVEEFDLEAFVQNTIAVLLNQEAIRHFMFMEVGSTTQAFRLLTSLAFDRQMEARRDYLGRFVNTDLLRSCFDVVTMLWSTVRRESTMQNSTNCELSYHRFSSALKYLTVCTSEFGNANRVWAVCGKRLLDLAAEIAMWSFSRVDCGGCSLIPFGLIGCLVKQTNVELDIRRVLMEREGFFQQLQQLINRHKTSWNDLACLLSIENRMVFGPFESVREFVSRYGRRSVMNSRAGLVAVLRNYHASAASTVFIRSTILGLSLLLLHFQQLESLHSVETIIFDGRTPLLSTILDLFFQTPLPVQAYIANFLHVLLDVFPEPSIQYFSQPDSATQQVRWMRVVEQIDSIAKRIDGWNSSPGGKNLNDQMWCIMGDMNCLLGVLNVFHHRMAGAERTGPTATLEKFGIGSFSRGSVRGLVVDRRRRERECSQCGRPEATKKCARCQRVYYCDRRCQVRHWKAHKPFCQPTKQTQQ